MRSVAFLTRHSIIRDCNESFIQYSQEILSSSVPISFTKLEVRWQLKDTVLAIPSYLSLFPAWVNQCAILLERKRTLAVALVVWLPEGDDGRKFTICQLAFLVSPVSPDCGVCQRSVFLLFGHCTGSSSSCRYRCGSVWLPLLTHSQTRMIARHVTLLFNSCFPLHPRAVAQSPFKQQHLVSEVWFLSSWNCCPFSCLIITLWSQTVSWSPKMMASFQEGMIPQFLIGCTPTVLAAFQTDFDHCDLFIYSFIMKKMILGHRKSEGATVPRVWRQKRVKMKEGDK